MNETEVAAVKKRVLQVDRGFSEGSIDSIIGACADHYFMFARNNAGDPTQWRPELFDFGLKGLQDGWADIVEVGHENAIEFVNIAIRNELAIAVTSETGRNKNVEWEDRITTWVLGRMEGEWYVLGIITQFADE